MLHERARAPQLAREFGGWFSSITSRPVTYWDERYTSSVAADILRDAGVARSKRKQRIDMLAAQILLQSYLDEQIRRREPPYVPEEDSEDSIA